MADGYTDRSIAEYAQRIRSRDPTLDTIVMRAAEFTDEEFAGLADALLECPDNTLAYIYVANCRLTDETGVKLARYIAASSAIKSMTLISRGFTDITFLALAAALRINSSLKNIYLDDNRILDMTRIETAFVEALWINPDRPAGSTWWLYAVLKNEFGRLQSIARGLGHPTLQMLLVDRC